MQSKFMRRKRIVRRTMGKDSIKKAISSLTNVGSGSTVGRFELATVQGRSADGLGQNIIVNQNTGAAANVGNVVKYFNITLQMASRVGTVVSSGWLEYAITMEKETDTSIPNTQIGVLTLGAIATRMFRGDCIFTGAIPVGANQPITLDLKIKVPTNKVKLQLGSNYVLHTYFRSTSSTDVSTDSNRLIQSCLYKLYV